MAPSSPFQAPPDMPHNLYSLGGVLGGVVAAAFIQAHMDLCLSWLEEQGLYFDMTLQRWMKEQSRLQYHAIGLANLPLDRVKEPKRRLTLEDLNELFAKYHDAEEHPEVPLRTNRRNAHHQQGS